MLNSNSTHAILPPMQGPMTFGQKIRQLRKARNLTQRELADKVAARLKAEDRRGFDFTYLSKIENDKTPPPSIPVIIQLARVLDGDEHELISLAGKVSPELGKALKESQGARIFYRSALNADLTEDDWTKLVQALKRRTADRANNPEPGD
jgi:transcriptional regulator with XRE-family HTH domain